MHLTSRPLLTSLPTSLLLAAALAFACKPGSLKLGDESDTDTSTSGGTDTDTDTDTDTGGPAGVVAFSTILPDIGGWRLAIVDDGTFYVAGAKGFSYQGGDGGTFASLWVGKFAADGSMLWEIAEPLEPEGSLEITDADAGPDGSLLLSVVDYTALEGADNVVRKLDPDGVELWSTVLPARASTVAATADGGVFVGGAVSTGPNSGQAWGTLLDDAGATLWEQTWGDPQMRWSLVESAAIDGDTLVLGGRLGVEPLSTRSTAWLHRAELIDGAPVWEQVFTDGIATDSIFDLGLDGVGRIIANGVHDLAHVWGFDAAGLQLWEIDPPIGGRTIGVAVDGSFALTDGHILPIDDPDACFGEFSPCPVAMRVVRVAPDQSIEWSSELDTCGSGNAVGILPDDRVLVIASCGDEVNNTAALGIFIFEP